MKYFIGFIVSFIVLGFFALLILKIWGIQILSALDTIRIVYSLGILAVSSLIFTIIIAFFFRNNNGGYNKAKGQVAHPRE